MASWSSRRKAALCRLKFRPRPADWPHERSTNVNPLPQVEDTPEQDIWTPHVRLLLIGTRDTSSPLSLFRGHESTIIKRIYDSVLESWRSSVTITPPAYSVGRLVDNERRRRQLHTGDLPEEADLDFTTEYVFSPNTVFPVKSLLFPERWMREELGSKVKDRPLIAFSPCGWVQFPAAANRNVNMMPFIMGEKESLPYELQPYYDSMIANCPVDPSELGKVMYLTVQESYISARETQRRAGLHVEAPGAIRSGGSFVAAVEHGWGQGVAFSPDELHGGIFIASNIDNTCAVWDALIDSSLGVVDSLGGIENLRPFIGNGKKIPANLLVWLTDRTPHEALPQEQDGFRQFFRLVTSEISVWFAAHSTPNPKVPVPDHIQIIDESKFENSSNLTLETVDTRQSTLENVRIAAATTTTTTTNNNNEPRQLIANNILTMADEEEPKIVPEEVHEGGSRYVRANKKRPLQIDEGQLH